MKDWGKLVPIHSVRDLQDLLPGTDLAELRFQYESRGVFQINLNPDKGYCSLACAHLICGSTLPDDTCMAAPKGFRSESQLFQANKLSRLLIALGAGVADSKLPRRHTPIVPEFLLQKCAPCILLPPSSTLVNPHHRDQSASCIRYHPTYWY